MHLNQPFCGFCICSAYLALKLALWWYEDAFVFWQGLQILRGISETYFNTSSVLHLYLTIFQHSHNLLCLHSKQVWYKNCSASFNLNHYLSCNRSFLWLFFSSLWAYYVSFIQPHFCTSRFLLSFFFLYSTWAFHFIILPSILYYMFL